MKDWKTILSLSKTNRSEHSWRRSGGNALPQFAGRLFHVQCGQYPDYVKRLFHKGQGHFKPVVAHSHVATDFFIEVQVHITHFSYHDYSDLVAKIRYPGRLDDFPVQGFEFLFEVCACH